MCPCVWRPEVCLGYLLQKTLHLFKKNVTFLFVLYVGVCFLGYPCRDLEAARGSWFFRFRGPEDQTQLSALAAITITL